MLVAKRMLYKNCVKLSSGPCFTPKLSRGWAYAHPRAFFSMDPPVAARQSLHVLVRRRVGSTLLP